MTNGACQELSAALLELHQLCPEIRFGQLIANLAVVARGTDPGAVWEIENDELLTAARRHTAELRARGHTEVA